LGFKLKVQGVCILICIFVIALDQVTKDIAVNSLKNKGVHLIGPVSFKLTFNNGISFGLLQNKGVYLTIILAEVLIGIFISVFFLKNTALAIGVGMVLGGGISNLADRIFRSYGVIDFIYTSFWPTFNAADSFVVIGCGYLLIYSLFNKSNKHN
jgi:signal peptidase II